MKLSVVIRRFLIPAPFVSLWYWLQHGCFIHYRSEVEFSPKLKIGRGTKVAAFTKIKAERGELIVGRNVTIGDGCHIGVGEGGLTIGDDCLIGPNVCIIGAAYTYSRLDIPVRLQPSQSKGTVLGKDVWLGAGCCILDGARIGDHAIITPNSVVANMIPDNCIVQGNPGKVIFRRR